MESVLATSLFAKIHSLVSTLMMHRPFITLFLPRDSTTWLIVLILKFECANNGLELFIYGRDWMDIFLIMWKFALSAFAFVEIWCFLWIGYFPEDFDYWGSYLYFVGLLFFLNFVFPTPILKRIVFTAALAYGVYRSSAGEYILDVYVLVGFLLYFYQTYKETMYKYYLLLFITFYTIWFTELVTLSRLDFTQIYMYSASLITLLYYARPVQYKCRFYQLCAILVGRVLYVVWLAIKKDHIKPPVTSVEDMLTYLGHRD